MMFKVLLCIPPDYDYNYPPLATPLLSAYLKKKGFDVRQIDLNIRYGDFLINHIFSSATDREEKEFLLKRVLKKFFAERLKNRYYSDFLPRNTDGTSPVLPYDNNTNSSFYFTERLLSSPYLWQYLEDRKENTFYQFYEEEKLIELLEKEDIKLLGFSIISPSQAIASFTLGLLVKKYLPHIHVAIGGQWPTLYRAVILEKKELFRCFDSLVVFEGETSLYNLATALKDKKDISGLPNIFIKNDTLSTIKNHIEENLDLLPCPDFDGLDLGDYQGSKEDSQLNLTYETSRGCYWSRCAYCVDLPLPKPSYRRKNPELVVNDIKQLKERHNADNLLLGDPGLSPRQMLEISKKIVDEGVQINWWCMARLDNGFTYEIFELAAKAGLKKINFGFESANDRICQLLDKGNQKERSLRVIRDCFEAGIEVGLQTMLGLPRESFDDGLETINFLVSNKKFISGVAFNVYYLTPANFIYQEPSKYGIEYEREKSLPFRFFIPFKNRYGMNKDEAYLLQKIYYSLIKKQKRDNQNKKIAPLEKTVFSSKEITEEWVELHLNQESAKLNYLWNRLKDEYTFMEEEKGFLINK